MGLEHQGCAPRACTTPTDAGHGTAADDRAHYPAQHFHRSEHQPGHLQPEIQFNFFCRKCVAVPKMVKSSEWTKNGQNNPAAGLSSWQIGQSQSQGTEISGEDLWKVDTSQNFFSFVISSTSPFYTYIRLFFD